MGSNTAEKGGKKAGRETDGQTDRWTFPPIDQECILKLFGMLCASSLKL